MLFRSRSPHQQGKVIARTPEVFGELGQSARSSWGLREALGAARALLSFPLEQCKTDPRATAWIASLESLLDYVHQCHAHASSTPTVHTKAVTYVACVEGGSQPPDLINDPQDRNRILRLPQKRCRSLPHQNISACDPRISKVRSC